MWEAIFMKKAAVFWIVCSGVIWFAVGVFLLLFGVKLVVFSSIEGAPHSPLFTEIARMLKSREQTALILVTAGLVLGFVKGRFVLSKTVVRVVSRIRALPEPIRFFDVYSIGYLALIASMILLGMTLRWLSVPSDIRGAIDIAVGSALMNGAMFYFRSVLKKEKVDPL
jgi:hypothetical protein